MLARRLAFGPFPSYEFYSPSFPCPAQAAGRVLRPSGGPMRFLLSLEHYQEMRSRADHTPDCYVRPGQYLHHLYMDGVKYVVAPALAECLTQAEERNDQDAVRHLRL